MVRYLFYTIGDLTYQSPLVHQYQRIQFDVRNMSPQSYADI